MITRHPGHPQDSNGHRRFTKQSAHPMQSWINENAAYCHTHLPSTAVVTALEAVSVKRN